MPTFREALKINEQYALDNNKEDSGVKLLLLHFSKMTSADLIMNINTEMPIDNYKEFLYGVDRYITKNIPVQHIIGYEYFYGHKFIVNKDVLIPRYETEELVAHVLMYYDEVFEDKDVEVLDIGTGSGCLAVTLDIEEQHMNVVGTDISNEALETAKQNNENLKGKATFLQGDLFEPIKGRKFDIIVSNPPYIPQGEYVEDLVVNNEPDIALFGGEDGLYFYRLIIEQAPNFVNDRFIIAFEHAYDKAKELKKIIQKHFVDVDIIQKKDMQGKDRMTFIIKK